MIIKVGFIIQDIISYNLFKDLILQLARNEKFISEILIAGVELNNLASEWEAAKIKFIDPFRLGVNINSSGYKTGFKTQKVRNSAKPFLPTNIRSIFSYIFLILKIIPDAINLKIKAIELRKELNSYHYIVTSQDRPFNTALLLLDAAYSQGIKIIQIPIAMLLEAEQAAWSRKTHSTYLKFHPCKESNAQNIIDTILNNIAGLIAPKHVLNSRYGKMLPYGGIEILKLKLAGLLTDNLWFHGTKYASFILMADSIDKSIFEHACGKNNNILVFGSPMFDKLNQSVQKKKEIRQKLYTKHKFDKTKELIIFNIQNFFEHKLLSEKESREFYCQVLDILKNTGKNIILTLHPSMNIERYSWLAKEYQIPILQVPLIEFLPAGDIYLTGPNSSTLRFANYINIKFTQLDFFSSQGNLSNFTRGYRTCNSTDELEIFLNEADSMRSFKEAHLVFDKSFCERFIELLKKDIAETKIKK